MKETYIAVTPDYKEADLGKVKVRRTIDLEMSEDQVLGVRDDMPDFEPVRQEMVRLEVLDMKLSELAGKKAEIESQIAEKEAVREKVEAAAKKVKLKK